MSRKRDLTRGAVIETAAELLDEQRGREITLAQVARRIGVRTPSLYNHVDSLEDLLQGVALLGVRELGNRIGKAAIARTGDEALRAIARDYRAFALQRPGLYLSTQRAPQAEQEELARAAGEILRVLQLVLEPYGLSDREQVHIIRALRSLVHGFVSLELNAGFGLPVDLDESFDFLVESFVVRLQERRDGELRTYSQSLP